MSPSARAPRRLLRRGRSAAAPARLLRAGVTRRAGRHEQRLERADAEHHELVPGHLVEHDDLQAGPRERDHRGHERGAARADVPGRQTLNSQVPPGRSTASRGNPARFFVNDLQLDCIDRVTRIAVTKSRFPAYRGGTGSPERRNSHVYLSLTISNEHAKPAGKTIPARLGPGSCIGSMRGARDRSALPGCGQPQGQAQGAVLDQGAAAGRLGVAVAETGHQDLWQRATLTAALTGGIAAPARGRRRRGRALGARALPRRVPASQRLVASVEDLRARLRSRRPIGRRVGWRRPDAARRRGGASCALSDAIAKDLQDPRVDS